MNDQEKLARYLAINNTMAAIKAVEAMATPLRMSPIMQTLDLINKSATYKNLLYPPNIRVINELLRPTVKTSNFHPTIWTADFIREMTRFQKSANPTNFRTDYLVKNLALMGFDQRTSGNISAYEYDLITEPKIEVPETKIILLDEVSRIKAAITEIYSDNEAIYRLEPYDFEQLVAELMQHKNFDVELTKRTRDGGYDLIALQDVGGFPYRFLVECKRFAKHRRVDVNIVRSFCQVMNEENNNGIIVTSAYFSADARKYKQKFAPYNLHFKDRDDVLDWVNQYILVQ